MHHSPYIYITHAHTPRFWRLPEYYHLLLLLRPPISPLTNCTLVTILDNDIIEPCEDFRANLSSPSERAVLSPSSLSIIIHDDEGKRSNFKLRTMRCYLGNSGHYSRVPYLVCNVEILSVCLSMCVHVCHGPAWYSLFLVTLYQFLSESMRMGTTASYTP